MVTIGPRSMSDNDQLTWHHMSLIVLISGMERGPNSRTTATDPCLCPPPLPEDWLDLTDRRRSAHTCHKRCSAGEKMQCPFCGSPHTQAYPAAYSSGTSQMQVRHDALPGLGGVSYGSVQTNLAQHCAPPRPPSPVAFVLAYAFAGFVLYDTFVVSKHVAWKQLPIAGGALLVGWVLWRAWRAAARLYSADKQRWIASFYCHGCGQSHVIA